MVRDLGSFVGAPAISALAIGGFTPRGTGAPLRSRLLPNRRKSVSHGLANLRNEDFRLLGVLARKMFERVDRARASEESTMLSVLIELTFAN
jgi:hypothetical protein